MSQLKRKRKKYLRTAGYFITKHKGANGTRKPIMSSMIDNNHNVDNQYLSGQVNNFYGILNSLRNERY